MYCQTFRPYPLWEVVSCGKPSYSFSVVSDNWCLKFNINADLGMHLVLLFDQQLHPAQGEERGFMFTKSVSYKSEYPTGSDEVS